MSSTISFNLKIIHNASNTCLTNNGGNNLSTLIYDINNIASQQTKLYKTKMLYNPYYKKCITTNGGTKTKNCLKSDASFRIVFYLLDPDLNLYLMYKTELFSMIGVNNGLVSQNYNFGDFYKNFFDFGKNDFFFIRNKESGECFTVDEDFVEEGADVVMVECGGRDSQLWRFIDF